MASLFVPDYIRNLKPYVPGKPIEETKREFGIKRVIKLASNENPLGPSPKAVAASFKKIKEAHRYPEGSAYPLKQALSRHLGLPQDHLIIGNGSNEVIEMLIRTFCLPGDYIVTSQTAFIAYRISAQIHGVETLEAPISDSLQFDLKAMAKIIRGYDKARIVFIPNPNNPTGTYISEKELVPFIKEISSLKNRNVLIVLDYAYWEYVTAPDFPDAQALMLEYPNVIVLRTFSKIYGLAGLRIGYGVGRPELISNLERVRQPFNINSVGLAAAEAALDDHVFVKKSKAVNDSGLKFWKASLQELGIRYWKTQGNFILIETQTRFGKRGGDVYLNCLKKGVVFRPVTNYGLMDVLRISVGTAAENKIAIETLIGELPPALGARKKKAGKK